VALLAVGGDLGTIDPTPKTETALITFIRCGLAALPVSALAVSEDVVTLLAVFAVLRLLLEKSRLLVRLGLALLLALCALLFFVRTFLLFGGVDEGPSEKYPRSISPGEAGYAPALGVVSADATCAWLALLPFTAAAMACPGCHFESILGCFL
jgi:hypothetical protein